MRLLTQLRRPGMGGRMAIRKGERNPIDTVLGTGGETVHALQLDANGYRQNDANGQTFVAAGANADDNRPSRRAVKFQT